MDPFRTLRPYSALTMLLTLCVAPAAAQQPSLAHDSIAIAEASRAFSRAYVEGDTATIASLYTQDALLLPPDRDVRGRSAAARLFWAPEGRRPAEHSMRSESLRIHGEVATDVGHWHATRSEEAGGGTSSGRYLVVWRRGDDGRWRIQYDMWHRPPPRD